MFDFNPGYKTGVDLWLGRKHMHFSECLFLLDWLTGSNTLLEDWFFRADTKGSHRDRADLNVGYRRQQLENMLEAMVSYANQRCLCDCCWRRETEVLHSTLKPTRKGRQIMLYSHYRWQWFRLQVIFNGSQWYETRHWWRHPSLYSQ